MPDHYKLAIGGEYHSYCPDCHKVIYNIHRYGPVTPYEYNRTFCTCMGKQTGIVPRTVTVYDLEDVLSPAEAKKERERQSGERSESNDR